MKAPLHPLINSSRSVIQPVTTQSTDPVGPAAAAGEDPMARMTFAEYERQAQPSLSPEEVGTEGEAPPYSGKDRRHKSRRQCSQPTTLDTRKAGLDRRKQGRISLKV